MWAHTLSAACSIARIPASALYVICLSAAFELLSGVLWSGAGQRH